MWGRIWLGVIGFSVLSAIALEQSVSPGAPLALTVGLAFFFGVVLTGAAALGWMCWRGLTAPSPLVKLPEDETLLASVLANHFSGWEGRGGRLFVTHTALHFVPHGFNFDLSPRAIPLSAIRAVEATGERTLLLQTDRADRFVVPGAPMLALLLGDALRGDRPLEAVLDLERFSAEASDRRVLTFRAR